MLRVATGSDVPELLEIYAPYIKDTAISFEYEVPTEQAFAERFRSITAEYPWLVCEEEGRLLGYAYASRAFARAAYAWTADMSVYLRPEARGRGIGRRLYRCLEALLTQMGIRICYGIITADNEPSIAFHRAMGYECEGLLRDCGWKSGRWHSVAWYAKRLPETGAPKAAPSRFCPDADAMRTIKEYDDAED